MGVASFRAEGLRELAFGSIVAGYTAIGTPFTHPISKIYVVNLTDADLKFSFKAPDDHFVLPSLGFVLYDVSTESMDDAYISIGTQIAVKRLETPTTGSVYVSASYSKTRQELRCHMQVHLFQAGLLAR